MSNRLAKQSSPYLLQHKDNPVDWYPWGDEAFAKARRRGVPILVSIGYSACHWCHVMAHESFEDPILADLMNTNFVNIKVDREERPDIDALYMQAVQAMGYNGGWPLNVFLTPDGLPFFGGTYWPPTKRGDLPSFTNVLVNIHEVWTRDRARIVKGGQDVAKHIISTSGIGGTPSAVEADTTQRVMRALYDRLDSRFGGFSEAPKFPQETVIEFLLRHFLRTGDVAALSMAELSLGGMAEGGIHDQLGGGFARYSVDGQWHVPHFEKMLYTNALLLPLYVDAWRITQEPLYLQTAEGIVGWLQREMLLPGGGFAAALDADSEGKEGTYYIWTSKEIEQAFSPEDAELLETHFGITNPGAFEGANVLRVVESAEDIALARGLNTTEVTNRLNQLKERMFALRAKRVYPHRDDKVIAAFNGLAIHALAYSGLVLQKQGWINLATDAATFITREMLGEDGRLARSWANETITADGVLDDYANMMRGLLSLHGATGDSRWLDHVWSLYQYTQNYFAHESGVGYYDTPDTVTDLFSRPRELTDGAAPAGNATMAEVLLILGVMRRDESLSKQARDIVESMAGVLPRYPLHLGMMASAAERMLTSPRELILAGPDIHPLQEASLKRIDPLIVRGYVAGSDNSNAWAYVADTPFDTSAMAYWCVNYTCQAPTRNPKELAEQMAP